MNFAEGMAWLHYCAQYRRRFGHQVPDWACTMEMSQKLRMVRVACAIGMPLAQTVLVRDEAIAPSSRWG